jgi:O-antigen/teichoic acid export membrane protein
MSLRGPLARLLGASVFAQAVPILAAPLLTRWYGADTLGQWALFAALAANLATIANARYEYAIVLPHRRSEAGLVLELCLLVTVVVALFTALGVGIVRAVPRWPARAQHVIDLLGPWLFVLPLMVALAGVLQALTLWNNRAAAFAVIARARVTQQVVMTLLQLAAPLLALGNLGALVIAQVVGAAAAPAWLLLRGERPGWRRSTNWRALGRLARRYRKFPLINSPHAFVNALQETLVLGVIAALAGVESAGYYAIGNRLVRMPANLIGGALSELLLGRLAADWRAGRDLRPQLKQLVWRLFAAAMIPMAILIVAGPALFGWALGDGWAVAGEYARWLAPCVAAHFIAAPLTVTPMVTGRQGGALMFGLVGNFTYVASIGGMLLAGHAVWQGLALSSVTMPLYFAAYLTWLIRGAGGKKR